MKAGDLVFYRGPGQERRTGIIVKQLSRPKFIDNHVFARERGRIFRVYWTKEQWECETWESEMELLDER